MTQVGNEQLHYFDHFGFEEEEEEETSSDEDDQERHLDAQITLVTTHSDLSSVTSMESDSNSLVSSTVPTVDVNNVVIVDATADASTTDETPVRHNSRSSPKETAAQKRKNKKSHRISEREFQTQIRSLLTVLMEANGTSAEDNLVGLLDEDGVMDLASLSSSSTNATTQLTELDLGMQEAIDIILKRSTNYEDDTTSIPSPQQVVQSLIKSLDTEIEDSSPSNEIQHKQHQQFYLQALPSGESSGFSAMYDDPMTWPSTSIRSSPDKDDAVFSPLLPQDEDSNQKQQEKEQKHHAVDDDTALKLYALLKDFDTELENVQLEQELSRGSASGTAGSDSSKQPHFLSATSTTSTGIPHDRVDEDKDDIRQVEMTSSRSLSSSGSKSSTPQIPHPPLLRRTSSSASSVPFPPLPAEDDERDAAAAASRKDNNVEQLLIDDHDIHRQTNIMSAFVIQNTHTNNTLNRSFNNIPTPLRSNVTGPRTILPRPERFEDSDEEISVYSYGSKSSLKLWGKKKKKQKKTGSSDVVSVSSSKSSKSKLFGRKKERKVRLLEAADDDMEEQGIWKDPFAAAEATTFTLVESLCESASGEGDSPQSKKMYGSKQNIRGDSSSFSGNSKAMVAPYTSDTYLPDSNNSRKLSWGELEVTTETFSSSSAVEASSSIASQEKKNISSSSPIAKPPTLIDSDGFLFNPEVVDEDPISPFFNAFCSSENHNEKSFWTTDTDYERPQHANFTTTSKSTATAAVDQVFSSTKERIEKLRAVIEEKSKVDPEGAKKLKIQLDEIESNAMKRISKVREAQKKGTPTR